MSRNDLKFVFSLQKGAENLLKKSPSVGSLSSSEESVQTAESGFAPSEECEKLQFVKQSQMFRHEVFEGLSKVIDFGIFVEILGIR